MIISVALLLRLLTRSRAEAAVSAGGWLVGAERAEPTWVRGVEATSATSVAGAGLSGVLREEYLELSNRMVGVWCGGVLRLPYPSPRSPRLRLACERCILWREKMLNGSDRF